MSVRGVLEAPSPLVVLGTSLAMKRKLPAFSEKWEKMVGGRKTREHDFCSWCLTTQAHRCVLKEGGARRKPPPQLLLLGKVLGESRWLVPKGSAQSPS